MKKWIFLIYKKKWELQSLVEFYLSKCLNTAKIQVEFLLILSELRKNDQLLQKITDNEVMGLIQVGFYSSYLY